MKTPRPFSGTKIVCTIGPATASVDVLVRLIEAGMDVARLNFSHGTHDDHRTVLRNVREAAKRTGEHIAVLQDLGGPKIRIGSLKDKTIELHEGATITFTTEEILGTTDRVSTTYAHLPADVRPNDMILLDDGKLRVRVVRTAATDVTCEVVNGGILGEKKGINLPGVPLSTPALTAKDIDDATFGMKEGVDYIALSFVRRAADLLDLRALVERVKGDPGAVPIIAKIEKQEALEDINAIIDEADGIMVARGDLGVEMSPEDVPIIQKNLVRLCNEAGVPVIIATQMLESMVDNPRPTRAEATDVANAVLDGADAVMLSAETSVGRFPVETVETMDRIIQRAETQLRGKLSLGDVSRGDAIFDAMARSACLLAQQVGADLIVPVTHTGATAIRLSRYRPHAPILAVVRREEVLRRLNLVWGVRGMISQEAWESSEVVLEMIKKRLVAEGYVQEGGTVVFTVGMPITMKGRTNTIKLERV